MAKSSSRAKATKFKKVILLIFLILIAVFILKHGFDYTILNRLIAVIKVWETVDIDINELSPGLSESDIIAMYPKLKLHCSYDSSVLGNRSCYTNVRRINDSDAWYLVFFFNDNKLSNIKMDFSSSGHENILHKLKAKYGEPSKVKGSTQAIPLIKWPLEQGILTTNEFAYRERTTQVLWIAY